MTQQSFIFGGSAPGAVSYEEMQRQRELAQALAARVGGAAPKNIGEGLSAIGAALASRKYRQRATEAESVGRAQAAEQFGKVAQQYGIDPSMMGAMNNPYMTDGQKAVVNALVSKQFAAQEPPKIETFYDPEMGGEYKAGFNPKTGSWDRIGGVKRSEQWITLTPQERAQMGIPETDTGVWQRNSMTGEIEKQGSGGTTVNVGGNNKFEEELAKRQAATYDELQKAGRAAQEQMSTLYAMKQLAANEGFYSGFGGEGALAAKKLGAAFGLDPNGIDSMEAFNGLAKGAALGAMGGSLGAGFSNADRDFVTGQVPNLANSPEGNMMLIEIQTRMAQRRADIAQLAQEYSNQNGGRLDQGFDRLVREYAEENPVFADMDFGAGAVPEGVTEEEISAAMEKYRLTREQVIEEYKKRQRQRQPGQGAF